jgi:hypothetical protein
MEIDSEKALDILKMELYLILLIIQVMDRYDADIYTKIYKLRI